MSEIPESIMRAGREAANAIVDRMCGTYRHDYGLLDDEARKALRGTFSQIAYHDVGPAIARAIMAEREACARIVEENDEWLNQRTSKRALAPRMDGNPVGLAYAEAIRNR